MSRNDRRRAAIADYDQAITTINALFDRVDDLRAARQRLTGIAPLDIDDDPIRDTETLLHRARLLDEALTRVRSAAVAAAKYKSRSDLADDIGTKPSTLFPRPQRPRRHDNGSQSTKTATTTASPAPTTPKGEAN